MTIKTTAAMAATTLLFALPVAAQERMFKSVHVDMDLESVSNDQAADFWSDLEGDLETAVLKQIIDQTVEAGDDGSVLIIDINEIAMANSFAAAFGADSTLVGNVILRNPDGTQGDFWELTVTVDRAGDIELSDDGMFVHQVDVDKAYTKMVNTFADHVVDRVK